jgi:hypothetical protein
LLAIGVWPRTANGGLRRLARVLTWIEAAILVSYGLVLTASGLLVQAGVIESVAHADRLALKWHAYLWDPWFLIWGIFVFLALWRSRSASQDHLPGAPGAAAARSYGYPGAAAGRDGVAGRLVATRDGWELCRLLDSRGVTFEAAGRRHHRPGTGRPLLPACRTPAGS